MSESGCRHALEDSGRGETAIGEEEQDSETASRDSQLRGRRRAALDGGWREEEEDNG